METPAKDLYYVAVKLFLRDDEKLLITHDIFGAWDLPGGRIRTDEFESPLEAVVERKVREELGDHIQYKIGVPKVFFRVERLENSTQQFVRIFGIGYTASYISGQIVLGDHHDKMEWVDVTAFAPEEYFTGGWLTGVQEYLTTIRQGGGAA